MTFISTYVFALISAHLLVPLAVFIQHLTHVYQVLNIYHACQELCGAFYMLVRKKEINKHKIVFGAIRVMQRKNLKHLDQIEREREKDRSVLAGGILSRLYGRSSI